MTPQTNKNINMLLYKYNVTLIKSIADCLYYCGKYVINTSEESKNDCENNSFASEVYYYMNLFGFWAPIFDLSVLGYASPRDFRPETLAAYLTTTCISLAWGADAVIRWRDEGYKYLGREKSGLVGLLREYIGRNQRVPEENKHDLPYSQSEKHK